MKSRLLPFELNVPLRSFLDVAVPLSVLSGHPARDAVLATYCIGTFFAHPSAWNTKAFRIVPTLDRAAWQRIGLLNIVEETGFRHSTFAQKHELIAYVIDCLMMGKYVECRLNEFFMPCRSSHKTVAADIHMNMVVGFDFEKELFSVAGYNRDYGVDLISFQDFAEAFFTEPTVAFRSEGTQYAWWKTMWLWAVEAEARDVIVTFPDFKEIHTQMQQYVTGCPVREGPAFEWSDREYSRDVGTWGINTYDAWKRYICWLKLGGGPIDLRATRTLWEHKVCMVLRLRLMKSAGVDVHKSHLDCAEQLKQTARWITLFSICYNNNRDKVYLDKTAAALEQLFNEEYDLYYQVIRRL